VKPVTALCLAALGLALIRRGNHWQFALTAGLVVAGTALVGLGQGLFGADLGVDPALGLTFAGASLALSRFEQHRFIATGLASLAGAYALSVLLSYLTGLATLFDLASVGLPALPTAAALLCFACGIISRIGITPALVRPQPLSHLQILLGCAIVAPLLLFGVYAGNQVADAKLNQLRQDLTSRANALSAEVDREIIGEIKGLRALAASPSLRQRDFAAFQRQAEALLAGDQSGRIMLVDRNMQQVANASTRFGTPWDQAAVSKSAETALATGKPQVTGLFTDPVTRQLLFAAIVPVQMDGENRYALVRLFGQHVLAGLIAAYELPPGLHATISDAPYQIVARSEPETDFGTTLPPARGSRTGPDGIFEFTDNEGRPLLGAYARSDLTGWETAVWGFEALLEAPVRTWWRTLGGLALVAFSLVLALASWLGRLIAGSLGHVAQAAAALREGRPPAAAEETPVAEVNALMVEVREAVARRQEFEAALRRSEAMFRAMFDFSSVGKVEIEPETGRFLRVNDAMCKFVGYSREELLARTVLDITHPDERARDRETLYMHDPLYRVEAGQLPVFDREKRYIRKDGKEVWARVTANVILDTAGRPVRCVVIQDLTARKQAEQALLASKDRLQLALEATGIGWWQYDPIQGVVSGDEHANEIFDSPKEGMTVEKALEKRVHPDDMQRVRAAFYAAIDPADPKHLSIDYRIRRRDGEVRWVDNHGLAYFEGDWPERRVVAYVGTIQDITERKEREEKEHLLMREINHRAKNMLSVVEAIAHQTAAKNPEDFIERFSERIQALSANQDLLVRNEWKGVDIGDLVYAQLAHFADLIGFRIAVQGPKLRLNPASVQAIGLALHELSTNAAKYGALSTDRGGVDISWESDGDTLTMNWIERDGPASPPKQCGFGTIVMEAMAERAVGGEVELDYAPSGVIWRLTCPADNVLERR
jgi:PAS domain S-box-containing protein